MVLGNLFRGQFIDVIEWLDPTNDTMVYRFERHNNEIKFGAQLTVRESQVAVFVNEGQIADVFQPGRYVLETANVPILSTLQAWKHGFNSPFKAEVYFFNTKRFTDLKWGTKNAIMIQDPQLGPIEVRAFGTYEMRLKDAPTFMKEVVGTDGHFTTEEIANQLRNLIVTRFQSAISSLNVPFAQVAANNEKLSEFLTQKIAPEFEQYGISLTKMLVENVSLPPEVKADFDKLREAYRKKAQMEVLGDINKYAQFQAADSIPAAAANPGGIAAMGVGLAMGQTIAGAMAQPALSTPPAGGAPPPLPQKQFFLALNGQQQGPFDMAQLQQQIGSGALKRDTLVWSQGMAGWTAAGQVAEIASLFAAAPPPLPPR
jgi:membrane protease subunit (stomatin/prohibitin family)